VPACIGAKLGWAGPPGSNKTVAGAGGHWHGSCSNAGLEQVRPPKGAQATAGGGAHWADECSDGVCCMRVDCDAAHTPDSSWYGIGGRCWISFQNSQSLSLLTCACGSWGSVMGKVLSENSTADRKQLRIVWGPQSKLLFCCGTVSIATVHFIGSLCSLHISSAKSLSLFVMASLAAGKEVWQLSRECRVCVWKSSM
jgi:hypothetical protein